MIRTAYRRWMVRFCMCILLVCVGNIVSAQELPVRYSIKDGKMFIEVSKTINYQALDSFMAQYNLSDVPLKELIRNHSIDSLKKLGWKVESNNKGWFVVSKTLFPVNNINNPSQKIIFTQKDQPNSIYPVNLGRVTYGYNRFRNKHSFAVAGSTVTFYLRSNRTARKVMLAGTFNNWLPDALAMIKTDSGWVANVKLEPGKHWYKFIIDDNWDIDNDNLLRENDGRGNVNSVFYKTNVNFSLNGYLNNRRVYLSGSFNDWRPSELLLNKTSTGWHLPLYLADGTHTYKFVVDGQWIEDPKNEKRVPDGVRAFNSVIELGKPYLFKLTGYTDAKQVFVMGSFNNWRGFELLMNKTSAGWQLAYSIPPGNFEYRFIVDGKQITDPANNITTSDTRNRGNSFLVIDPNYTFRLKGFPNAKTVFVAGDFNNWNSYSLPMKRDGDEWIVKAHLSPGKHLYKLIIDGQWIIDPGNKLWEQNEFGTGNSILWIER